MAPAGEPGPRPHFHRLMTRGITRNQGLGGRRYKRDSARRHEAIIPRHEGLDRSRAPAAFDRRA